MTLPIVNGMLMSRSSLQRCLFCLIDYQERTEHPMNRKLTPQELDGVSYDPKCADDYLFFVGYALLAMVRIIIVLSPVEFVRSFGERRDLFDDNSANLAHNAAMREMAGPSWNDVKNAAEQGDDVDADNDAMMRAIANLITEQPDHDLVDRLQDWINDIDPRLGAVTAESADNWRKRLKRDRNHMLDMIGKTNRNASTLLNTDIVAMLVECRQWCSEADTLIGGDDKFNRVQTAQKVAAYARLLSQKLRELWPAVDDMLRGDAGKDQKQPQQDPVDSSTDDEAKHCFRKSGEHWKIRFEDEEGTFKDRKGLAIIHKLLERPNPSLPMTVLELQGIHLTSAASVRLPAEIDGPREESRSGDTQEVNVDDVVDSETLDGYNAELKHLEQERKAATLRGDDPSKATELEDDINQIRKQRNRDRRVSGRTRRFPNDIERAKDAARRNLSRTYEALENEMPKLIEHLDRSIVNNGFTYAYRTARDIPWVLR